MLDIGPRTRHNFFRSPSLSKPLSRFIDQDRREYETYFTEFPLSVRSDSVFIMRGPTSSGSNRRSHRPDHGHDRGSRPQRHSDSAQSRNGTDANDTKQRSWRLHSNAITTRHVRSVGRV